MTDMAPETDASWTTYRELVLQELERLNTTMRELTKKIDENLDRHRQDVDRRNGEVNRRLEDVVKDLRQEATQRNDAVWKKLSDLDVGIAMLQVKSGVWGGIAGAVIGIAAYFATHAGGH